MCNMWLGLIIWKATGWRNDDNLRNSLKSAFMFQDFKIWGWHCFHVFRGPAFVPVFKEWPPTLAPCGYSVGVGDGTYDQSALCNSFLSYHCSSNDQPFIDWSDLTWLFRYFTTLILFRRKDQNLNDLRNIQCFFVISFLQPELTNV